MTDNIRDEYDKFYDRGDWKNTPQLIRLKLKVILKVLKVITKNNPQTILDAGCGTGLYSHLFSCLSYKVYGFDFSKTAIQQA